MSISGGLHLFDGYGVEVEYMIVDSRTLDVMPVTDVVLKGLAGAGEGVWPNDAEIQEVAISNEFVLHVIELCNAEPAGSLTGLAGGFHRAIAGINKTLEPIGARLLPGAMHPWMDPATEARLWPHAYSTVYNTYNRIFNCRRHGWANVQSAQLNISFSGDMEFGLLHGAMRFLMPVLPALAASSPVAGGRVTGFADTRLVHYRTNQAAVPSVSGSVIPEPVYTEAAYRQEILEKMYREIAPHDPEGILRHEWLNSRGAIARFDRSAIELRVLDMQECPSADLAVAEAVSGALRKISDGRWADPGETALWPAGRLVSIFDETIRHGQAGVIEDAEYLSALGMKTAKASAAELWRHLAGEAFRPAGADSAKLELALGVILEQGTLSKRVLDALGPSFDKEKLREVYSRLCDCLADNRVFLPGT